VEVAAQAVQGALDTFMAVVSQSSTDYNPYRIPTEQQVLRMKISM
jgi:hypothetical protein